MKVVPLADVARDRDAAAVQRDQLVHQRQPDARSLVRARARASHAVEALEHVRQLLGRDADAGVAHRQLDVDARATPATR